MRGGAGVAPEDADAARGSRQIPSIFLASPSDFIESSCLPALCAASPSARNCLTLAMSPSLSFGLVASLASIAFISLGQLWASARPAQLASAMVISSFFMQRLLDVEKAATLGVCLAPHKGGYAALCEPM